MTKRLNGLLWLGLGLMLAGAGFLFWGATQLSGVALAPAPLSSPAALTTPLATATAEPLIPTRTPAATATATATPSATPKPPATPRPSATATAITPTPAPATATRPPQTPSAAATPRPTAAATLAPTAIPALPIPSDLPAPTPTTAPTSIPPAGAGFVAPAAERSRLCVSLPYGAPGKADLTLLKIGWTMDWSVRSGPAMPTGIAYAQTVRMSEAGLRPDAARLTAVAAANPGATWLISNEPDVRWQDNVPPQTYARLYHEAYHAIKAGDPGAVVAAGGISQPTPLRLRYLDAALETYQTEFGSALPAQAWQIHNYMLREERDSWGVDIPPGFSENTGVLFSIDDSGNLAVFKAQIVDFRRWMAARGYGGLPLIVSEYGIPMPPDYGFPLDRVAEYMRETWRYFMTAADGSLGNPADGGRLVQRWCWFSMYYAAYPTGNLVEADGGAWTPLARIWMSYVAGD